MNATHKQMIEDEIKTLQGELNTLVLQKQGFLMGAYADWSSAIQKAKDRGWRVTTYGGTEYYLDKMDKDSITIDFKDNYTHAMCTRRGKVNFNNTPEELLTYLNTYAI
jgi:regulatory protein YycI of two-component signal transduction system YycFG